MTQITKNNTAIVPLNLDELEIIRDWATLVEGKYGLNDDDIKIFDKIQRAIESVE